MSTRISAGITAIIAAGALAIPATGVAKTHPAHTQKTKVVVACPTHKTSGKHKGTRGQRNGSTKGKKCYRTVATG